jgi:hypothetical protein
MGKFIIEVVARPVLKRIKRSGRQCPHGSQQVTRKKPHVIDVALEQNTQHSCWYIMWMVIYTMPTYVI